MKSSFLNDIGRLECDSVEFHCGELIEVFFHDRWQKTRLEHSSSQGGYYSIDGYPLLGNPIRPVTS
ncbi:DUF5348 domain-containing protein [Idiomarina sp. HP20-50]|uniref:DUF5348 domain-containing protein n=1 Tax=Idiomarina sp. HP20-50 TaxID=3070813 RepID=UPI003982119F